MIPDRIELLKAGDRARTMSSAGVANELIEILNALRKMEVQDYEVLWADGNVMLRKIDKTRDGDAQGGVGGVVKCTWAP